MATGAGTLLAACGQNNSLVARDVGQVDYTRLGQYAQPYNYTQISRLLEGWNGAVCVAGGKYSMGGQTRHDGALQLDMRSLNRVLWINKENKTARVQAGTTWRALIGELDKLGLSVKVMQSFSNFTVGGSIGVNCHGRYVNSGAVGSTVREMLLMLPSGEVITANRVVNSDVFAAVLGGYGGVAIVLEVELDVADNIRIKRSIEYVELEDYPQWFASHVAANGSMMLHNADLVPPDFKRPLAVNWVKTQDPLTDETRVLEHGRRYSRNQNLIWVATEFPAGDRLRETLTGKSQNEPKVIWRNLEASLDVQSLEPRTRLMSTYLLQEYFVPVAGFAGFVKEMSKTLRKHNPNILNISIRHCAADPDSLLAWAQDDVFCFVLYYKQRNFDWVDNQAAQWTRELVDCAIDHGGRHYLPYRLHATKTQVWRAYPGIERWLAVKAKTDPEAKLRNLMLDKYMLR